ncbi:hypothetical protein [Clostridium botulinum]|nr:hypothetical protein [Clostridium botulinum]MBY6898021.1 hypothetical protein [Clostridium botulinum]MBY6912334.1 hypothetical protein [Clostridium botulinum]MCR1176396.1 hypothetical protein [Clostridium botulinum]
MFIYKNGEGYSVMQSPLHKEYGMKKDDGSLYTKYVEKILLHNKMNL